MNLLLGCIRTPFLLAAFFSIAATSHAQVKQPVPKEISDAYSTLTHDFTYKGGGLCGHRAMIWTAQLNSTHLPRAEKIMVLYTWKHRPHFWDYHIASSVNFEGKTYVFERENGVNQALTLADWIKATSLIDISQCSPFRSDDPELLSAFLPAGKPEDGWKFVQPDPKTTKCFYGAIPSGIVDPNGTQFYDYLYRGVTPLESTVEETHAACLTLYGLFADGTVERKGMPGHFRRATTAEVESATARCRKILSR